MITDFSNIYFEFVKLFKPVIFYEVNKPIGYDYKNSVGKVLIDEEDVINRIIGYINMNFRLERYYEKKIENLQENVN